MPHDPPDLPEILRTVREFVHDLVPRLEGLDRYHALCARHLLDIASRELTAEWRHETSADDRRLQAFLGSSAVGEALLGEFCARIAAGAYDGDLESLHEVLLAHVTGKVQVTRPGHLLGEED